jgi:hypothetical protein
MNQEYFYDNPATLFTGSGDVVSHLRNFRDRMRAEVRDWDEDELLKTPHSDIVDYLVSKYSVECPVLDRDGGQLLPGREITVHDGRFGPIKTRRRVLLLPFAGTSDVFRLTPSTISAQPPRANIDGGLLGLVLDGTDTPAANRAAFDRQIEIVEQYLGWLRGDIDSYKTQLEASVSSTVASRCQEILTLREEEASIGFPVIRAADSSTFAFPVARRQIVRPAPLASGPFVPEPVFAQEDYEAALQIISNARNGFERSPSTTAKLDEEEIRDLLLVILNGHFQGAAGGELFNGDGKTDILIRAQDRNIFIGECKIWHGQAMIAPTLDQLLSYMVWRDTKGALLLFIRNKDVSAAIANAVEALKAHPQFKCELATQSGERYDFLFSSVKDPDREIRLAFIPFAIGS